jgi:hypothetical protein
LSKLVEKQIKKKIYSYKQQDILKKIYNHEKFISLKEILNKMDSELRKNYNKNYYETHKVVLLEKLTKKVTIRKNQQV